MTFDDHDIFSMEPDPSADDVLRELEQVPAAPDLTGSVMARLGYVQASRAEARRQRLRAWMSRGVVTGLMALACTIAYQVYHQGPDIRRVEEVTLPGALSEDLQEHQDHFNGLMQTIRHRGQAWQWGGAQNASNSTPATDDEASFDLPEMSPAYDLPAPIETSDDAPAEGSGAPIVTIDPWCWV